MDFVKTVPIFVTSIFPKPMIHCLVAIPPLSYASIDAVFIGEDERTA